MVGSMGRIERLESFATNQVVAYHLPIYTVHNALPSWSVMHGASAHNTMQPKPPLVIAACDPASYKS